MITKTLNQLVKEGLNRKFLVLVFAIALIVRMWNLGIYPDAIDEDEMALGYYGYSLLTRGTDEYGNIFPIYFESVGDYKYGLYSYLTIIPVSIFGLNAFSARAVAALAGAFSVIVIYFLALEIFRNKKFAHLSAFILALSPIHIHFSRVAYNNVLGSLFATISILFLIKWLKKVKNINLVASIAFYILAIYSYQAYRILMPVVFVALILLYSIKQAHYLKSRVLVSTLAILIVLLSFASPSSRARSQDFATLYNEPRITEQHTEDAVGGISIISSRIYHNKPISSGIGFMKRYLAYFDPSYLFIQTSSQSQRHSTPDIGYFHLLDAPLFLVGLLFIFKKIKSKSKFIPLILLFSAPLAASLIIEPQSTTRSIYMTIPVVLFAAFGALALIDSFKAKNLVAAVFVVLYLVSFSYFAHQYTVHKVYHHPWYSDVGLREMVESVNEKYDNYEKIVVSRGHYIPFLFYNKVDPAGFVNNSDFSDLALDKGSKVVRYDKIFFNMPYDCPLAGKENTLYVCFGYQIPLGSNIVDVIRFKDGQPAIILVEFNGDEDMESKLPERVEYFDAGDERFINGVIPENYEKHWPV